MTRRLTPMALLAATVLSMTPPATAQVPQRGTDWYYTIGGGTPVQVAPPPWQLSETFGFRGAVGYEIGDVCGAFDPGAALQASLEGTVEQFEELFRAGMTTAMIGFVMNELANRAPQLYDLMKDLMWRMDNAWNVQLKNCRDMMADIDAGKNPYDDFIQVARSGDMQSRANNGEAIQYATRDSNGDDGIPWVTGDNAGGRNQPPINVVEDSVTAGYNILLGRSADDGTAPNPGTYPHTLVTLWGSPDQAAEWVKRVVGDVQLSTYEGGGNSTVPGHGLLPLLNEEAVETNEVLADIVSSNTPPTSDQIKSVSAPGRTMTYEVIASLRTLAPSDQGFAISRLAEELAFARITERTLYARRMLLTGKREPNISQSPAPPEINVALAELKAELEDIAFEYDMRQKVVSATANYVIQRAREGGAAGRPYREANDTFLNPNLGVTP